MSSSTLRGKRREHNLRYWYSLWRLRIEWCCKHGRASIFGWVTSAALPSSTLSPSSSTRFLSITSRESFLPSLFSFFSLPLSFSHSLSLSFSPPSPSPSLSVSSAGFGNAVLKSPHHVLNVLMTLTPGLYHLLPSPTPNPNDLLQP